ncbi:myomegalin isoform X2 [Artibeus jamaicensis]|uniref:myomegalin isoform X2 n=1 Tax=Artibeus jamaicensis TaxID=9417 RepID=UPI00235A4F49|nr:myomegalin isoform X2 [Artibeus jamaicensis]
MWLLTALLLWGGSKGVFPEKILQLKAGMHQPLERKGPAERGVDEQEAPPEEAGPSSESHSRKYSLIQHQARELTRLRQKVRLGGAVSSLLIQHVKNTVKNFEELLSSSKLDRSVEQHFHDYINKKNQRGQMLRTLSILRKMNKMGGGTEVLETREDAPPWTLFQIHSSSCSQWTARCYPSCASPLPEEQKVRPLVNVANGSLATPADPASLPSPHSGARPAQSFFHTGHRGCSSPGDETRPQKMNASGHLSSSSSSSFYRPSSTSSGADLLEKNLVEIQNLRQRLEDSVCTNDRLQERLEHALSNLDEGAAQ